MEEALENKENIFHNQALEYLRNLGGLIKLNRQTDNEILGNLYCLNETAESCSEMIKTINRLIQLHKRASTISFADCNGCELCRIITTIGEFLFNFSTGKLSNFKGVPNVWENNQLVSEKYFKHFNLQDNAQRNYKLSILKTSFAINKHFIVAEDYLELRKTKSIFEIAKEADMVVTDLTAYETFLSLDDWENIFLTFDSWMKQEKVEWKHKI